MNLPLVFVGESPLCKGDLKGRLLNLLSWRWFLSWCSVSATRLGAGLVLPLLFPSPPKVGLIAHFTNGETGSEGCYVCPRPLPGVEECPFKFMSTHSLRKGPYLEIGSLQI